MTIEVQDLVRSGIYPSVDVAVREAIRVLRQERPSVRIEVAIRRYRTEDLSIAGAAALAGVSFDRMKELLAERGVPRRLGPETLAEARTELDALQRMRA
jgi:predicted HTH domain antitoxin